MDIMYLVLWLLSLGFTVWLMFIDVKRGKYTTKTAVKIAAGGIVFVAIVVMISTSTDGLWKTFSADQIELEIDSESILLEADEIFVEGNGVFHYRVDMISRLKYMWKEPYATISFIEDDKTILKARVFAFDVGHDDSNYLNDKPVKIYWRGHWIVYGDSFYINLDKAVNEIT